MDLQLLTPMIHLGMKGFYIFELSMLLDGLACMVMRW